MNEINISNALDRYGISDKTPISDEMKQVFIELAKMDEFLEGIISQSSQIDSKINKLRKDFNDTAKLIYNNRSVFKSVNKKHGELIAALGSLAVAGVGELLVRQKENEKKKAEELKKAELLERRRLLAQRKRDEMIFMKDKCTSMLEKRELVFIKESSKKYSLSDDRLSTKLYAFELIVFSFYKIKYCESICDYFIQCFNSWINNIDYKENVPDEHAIFKHLTSRFIHPNTLTKFMTSDDTSIEWPVSLLVSLYNPYILMSNVGINIDGTEKAGKISLNGSFYSNDGTMHKISDTAYSFLNKNSYVTSVQEIQNSCPQTPKGFSFIDLICIIISLSFFSLVLVVIKMSGGWFWILAPLYFYVLAKYLPNIVSSFPYIENNINYCKKMEEYNSYVDTLYSNIIFKPSNNEDK